VNYSRDISSRTKKGVSNLLVRENFSPDEQQRVKETIEGILGDQAEVILLCLTGSRAYGWGGTRYDFDVRGLFMEHGDYWDGCHFGKRGLDITLEEVQHFLRDMKWRWVLYEDMSMPFYISEKFDWSGFQSFCAANHVRGQQHTTDMEIERMKNSRQPRKTLHCYRQVMVPIHFLETGVINIDVLELNGEFNSPWVPKLTNIYLHQEKETIEWKEVFAEVDSLRERLHQLLDENDSEFDAERFTVWRRELEGRLYG